VADSRLLSNSYMKTKIRNCLLLAGVLFVLELLLGIGLIGIIAGISIAIAQALASRAAGLRRRFLPSSIFLLVALATFGWLSLNVEVGKRNGIPIIRACEKYREAYHRYPSSLHDLVPEFLPSIPRARHTVVARDFIYGSEPPGLCFSAMFHGLFCYDFAEGTWTTND
jgi:hypothetical protein